MIWAGALLALTGLGLAWLVGRRARPPLVPVLVGAIIGVCGVGAKQLTGLGDLGLGTRMALMAAYGAGVGGVALMAGGGKA